MSQLGVALLAVAVASPQLVDGFGEVQPSVPIQPQSVFKEAELSGSKAADAISVGSPEVVPSVDLDTLLEGAKQARQSVFRTSTHLLNVSFVPLRPSQDQQKSIGTAVSSPAVTGMPQVPLPLAHTAPPKAPAAILPSASAVGMPPPAGPMPASRSVQNEAVAEPSPPVVRPLLSTRVHAKSEERLRRSSPRESSEDWAGFVVPPTWPSESAVETSLRTAAAVAPLTAKTTIPVSSTSSTELQKTSTSTQTPTITTTTMSSTSSSSSSTSSSTVTSSTATATTSTSTVSTTTITTTTTERPCIERNVAWEPMDMPGTTSTMELDQMACQRRCLRTPECFHFTYWEAFGHCHLQDQTALRRAGRQGFVAGPFQCWSTVHEEESDAVTVRTDFVPDKFKCMTVGVTFEPAVEFPTELPGSWADVVTQCQGACFVSNGCTHFAVQASTFACKLSTKEAVPMPSSEDWISGPPVCDTNTDVFMQKYVETSLEIPRSRLEEARPSMCLAVLFGFSAAAMHLVRRRWRATAENGRNMSMNPPHSRGRQPRHNLLLQEADEEME